MTAVQGLRYAPDAAHYSAGGDTVRRAVPQWGREWAAVAGQVSCVLADIVHAPDVERGAQEVPRFRQGLQAWTRLSAAIEPTQRRSWRALSTVPDLGFVTVAHADVTAFGAAAGELGHAARSESVHAALARSAAGLGRAQEHLAALLARVHGVLDLDLGADGETLRSWGADGPVFVTPPGEALAAHRRIAVLVHSRWQAGGARS